LLPDASTVDQIASLAGLRFQDASPATAGDLVLVLVSGAGTAMPTAFNNLGFSLNLTQLVGLTFWAAAVTIGPAGFRSFTDPIRFR